MSSIFDKIREGVLDDEGSLEVPNGFSSDLKEQNQSSSEEEVPESDRSTGSADSVTSGAGDLALDKKESDLPSSYRSMSLSSEKFADLLSSLNIVLPLDNQKTLVSVDRNNLVKWVRRNPNNPRPEFISESDLIEDLITTPSVAQIKVYSVEPVVDPMSVEVLERWLRAVNERVFDELSLSVYDSKIEYYRALIDQVKNSARYCRLIDEPRRRFFQLLDYVDSLSNLEYWEEMGAEVTRRRAKVIPKRLNIDPVYRDVVARLIYRMDVLEEWLEKNSVSVLPEEIENDLFVVKEELAAVQGMSDELLGDDWHEGAELIEKRLVSLVEGIGSAEAGLMKFVKAYDNLCNVVGDIRKMLITNKVPFYKCDLDIKIALDMQKEIEKYDNFVVLSGDGDFRDLYDVLTETGKKVMAVSTEAFLGVEVRNKRFDGEMEVCDAAAQPNWWALKGY